MSFKYFTKEIVPLGCSTLQSTCEVRTVYMLSRDKAPIACKCEGQR